MIELRDSVVIHVPPERVWAWLSELPMHYREWHPAHVDGRYAQGDQLAVGALLQVDERLHGKPHSLKFRADVVVPHRLLRYSGRGFRGAFVLEPTEEGTRFTAELAFGLRLPFIERLLDRVLRRWLASRLSALQAHMREEGVNLKQLLEAGHAA